MSTIGLLVGMVLFGYLLGSIPFGLVLTRAAGLGDVRKIGSGNIGATNVLRTGNKGLAAATLLLDALKGTAAVVIGWWVAPRLAGYGSAGTLPTIAYAIPVAAGLGAVLGHLYPVWLGFKGGKGVATFIGVLLGLAWPLALIFCAIWLLVAGIARYSSLASLVATLAVTFLAALGGDRIGMPRELVLAMKPAIAVMALLLIVRHHGNIKRLLAGEEPRIGQKRDSSVGEAGTGGHA